MGALEQLQEQTVKLEAMLDRLLYKLEEKKNEVQVWQSPVEICHTFGLERRMFKELLAEGTRRGIVKTLVFSPTSQKPQQRIDVTSFRRFLEAGGCLNS